jgi:hypothetical protein
VIGVRVEGCTAELVERSVDKAEYPGLMSNLAKSRDLGVMSCTV